MERGARGCLGSPSTTLTYWVIAVPQCPAHSLVSSRCSGEDLFNGKMKERMNEYLKGVHWEWNWKTEGQARDPRDLQKLAGISPH